MTTVSYSRNTPLQRVSLTHKKSGISSGRRYAPANKGSSFREKRRVSRPHLARFFDRLLGPAVSILFIFGLGAYLYMAISLVLLTVERKALEEKIAKETTELSYAQLSYSDALKKIETKDVYAGSFTHSSGGLFATREVSTSLTYKNN
jgi:hypothetical protein